ncbi:MAG TPA: aminotransferase class I/II-fold pyridoxal phosphate-dependent enzyme [Reyranella sp.]|nr:aminotransferase class I/II-fold pyridoxal phosphate-dependent enzyme [Reyranella sp.]
MPSMAAEKASLESPHNSPYVCRRSDSVFSAIEKCLDNGLGSCLVVEENERLVGRISLDDIRRSILDGVTLPDLTVEHQLAAKRAQASAHLRNDTADNDVLRAIVDHHGHLTGVQVDRSMQPIQVSRPDLSHREFRSVLEAFISSWISSKGPYVEKFEGDFSEYVGAGHGIAVTNGTVALHLALMALGIGPGDEVIVPDLTFAATINAVLYCGAQPVIVDVDANTWTMTREIVEAACTSRTRAIIPVHLYGRPAEIGPIVEFARGRGIAVIEDCAEAPGARYGGKMVGQHGDIGCFSFYANKIVTTGEGGMCLTDSPELATSLRCMRDHGMTPGRSYWHERIGYNYRLTNLQAAIGHAQMWRIGKVLERNHRIERLYRRALAGIPGVRFAATMGREYEPVVWLASVLVPAQHRDAIIAAAQADRIEMRPFFYRLSDLPPYAGYARHCPNSAALSASGINLPTSRDVDDQVVERVVGIFRSVLT